MRVVVLGDMIYDCFIWADHLPRMGETVTGYANGFYSGGKGANQAVQAARLGAETYMLGKVGDDERGQFIIRSLKGCGVNTDSIVVDKNEATSTCCVHVDKNGNNAIIVAPMANEKVRQSELEAVKPLIQSADIFICQLQLNLDAVETGLRYAHEAGVTTVLNPAPAKEIPDSFYQLSDYFTPNETETEFYTKLYRSDMPLEEWYQKVAAFLHGKGTRNVVITLGEKGCLYSSEKETFIVPPFSIQAVDSTAAGDSFNAGFSVRIAAGASVREALRFGNACGALTAMKQGSMPSLPMLSDVEAFLKDHA